MAAQTIIIELIQPDQTPLDSTVEWSLASEDSSDSVNVQSLVDKDETDSTIEKALDPNVKLSRALTASKLLEDLDKWTEEGSESCPDWFEEPIDLPIYEELPPNQEPDFYDWTPNKPSQMHLLSLPLQDLLGDLKPYLCSPPADIKVENPSLETGTTIGVETCTPHWTPVTPKPDALTPPESPKDDDYLLTTMLDGIEPELCNELEELVRMHAENLVDDFKDESSGESGVECNSGAQSHEDDTSDSSHSASVSSPSFSDSSSDDPEWMPADNFIPTTQQQPKRKRNTKPYSRSPPEEKRLRKKEQNKNAATRYRLKKKAEVEEILSEEKELQDRNDELQHQVVELAREIKYLKSLMKDVFKASGLMK